jgi:trigger factor
MVGGSREGERAEITVQVVQVQQRTLPDVDDDFAQLVSSFDTLDEMRQDLRKAVEQMAVISQFSAARAKVLDQMIEMTPFDVPERVLSEEAASRTSAINEQLKAAGITLEDYLSRMGDPEISTAEQFAEDTVRGVSKGIRTEILLGRIATQEKVAVSQEDLTNYILQKAQENQTTPEQELEHMRSHDHLGEWMGRIRQSKALDLVVSKAKITDTNGKVVDLDALVMPPTPQS